MATGGGAPKDLVASVATPLGVQVRITKAQWARITEHKHPVMQGKEAAVAETLRDPAEVRRSRRDPSVHYYKPHPGTPYHVAVVVKHLNGEGFVITAYLTDRVKEGDPAWTP